MKAPLPAQRAQGVGVFAAGEVPVAASVLFIKGTRVGAFSYGAGDFFTTSFPIQGIAESSSTLLPS